MKRGVEEGEIRRVLWSGEMVNASCTVPGAHVPEVVGCCSSKAVVAGHGHVSDM